MIAEMAQYESEDLMEADIMTDYIKNYYKIKRVVHEQNKGKGWKEVKPRPIRVDYGFKCNDCGAQIDGFVVSPRFCPYCGKEHG